MVKDHDASLRMPLPGPDFFDGPGRLAFLGIDDETRADLAAAWTIIEPDLPAILAAFYARMRRVPALAGMLAGDDSVARLKHAQYDHWRTLFCGHVDASYMQRVFRVGLTHQRIGLEPRWYLGGYAFILERLLSLLAGKRLPAAELARLTNAVIRAVTLDVDLAVASYLHAMEATQADRRRILARAFETDVKAMVDAVADTAGTLRAAAGTMAELSEQTGADAGTATEEAAAAAASVQTVAAASEELTSAIAEVGRQAAVSAVTAETGVRQADTSAEAVGSLAEAAGRIARVAAMIDRIARQTNMLALNAAIEAARAGAAGRGFAVVAQEVKQLAKQTAQATETIAEQIATIRTVSDHALTALSGMGSTIAAASEAAQAIASAVEEQAAATAEISRSAQRAATGTQTISDSMVRVNVQASTCGDVAGDLLARAGTLSGQAAGLAGRVESFLALILSA